MRKAKAKYRGRDPLPEYDFSRGVRGEYARRFAEGTNLVKLEPDCLCNGKHGIAAHRFTRSSVSIS